MVFSNEEAFDMLMVLGECFRNYRAAARLYVERYPLREHQSYNVFQRLASRIVATGHVQPDQNKNKDIIKPVVNERAPEVIAAVEQDPNVSTRRLSVDSGVSQTSVCRILQKGKFHPYHISLHQELSNEDFERRLAFCTWAHLELEENNRFFENVLWSDEATFRSNGDVNKHNLHYWSLNNPHWLRTVDRQRYWTLNTYCGILDDQIIGPYFFEGNLNGAMYEEFVRNSLPLLLENVNLERRQQIWYMQDGCPAHYDVRVRNTLTEMFDNRWIGRGGNITLFKPTHIS